MSKFEWRTEEDWEELAAPEQPKRSRPRRWQWLVTLTIFLGLAGYFVYNQVEQRIEEATHTVEQDVLSSLDVLQTANANRDVELVNGVLSGRDPQWTDIQRDLIRHRLLFDRTPFGLTLIGTPEVIETTLAPDLLTAELNLHAHYAIAIGNGLTQTITLEHQALFRKGARNWLYAPPETEFWGEMQSISGSFLTLHYPARDADISRRLANDLERKIGEMCAMIAFDAINCLRGSRVELTLANHAAGLVMANEPELWLQAGRTLVLPAPTLVGLPLNEQGYQALFRGYAVVTLQAFIGERTGWQCCERAVLVQALLDRQFSLLSLKPWPLLPQDYANLLNQGVLIQDVVATWDQTSFREPDPALYALADFLQTVTEAPAPLVLIPIAAGDDLTGWLTGVLRANLASPESNRQWQAFLYQQSGLANRPPPVPWPDQAISMLCGPNFPDAAALYTYHPAEEQWREQLGGRAFFTAQSIPEQPGLVLIEQSLGAENRPPQTVFWRGGVTIPLLERGFVLQAVNPAGTILAGGTLKLNPNTSTHSADAFLITEEIILIDLDTCTNEMGSCSTYSTPLPNLHWSPNGDLTLSRVNRPGSISELRLGDNIGQNHPNGAVGLGTSATWLDNEHIIHLRSQEVVITHVYSKKSETVLAERDLLPLLPENSPISRLTINEIGLSQSDPNLLFVLASSFNDLSAAYLFQLNLSERQATYLTRLDDVPIPSVEIGKTFRIPVKIRANQFQVLVTIVHGTNIPVYYFYSYQMAQDKISLVKLVGGTNSGNYDWSNDGYWLVTTDAGHLKLIAPGWGYQRWVPHAFANCRAVNWLNE